MTETFENGNSFILFFKAQRVVSLLDFKEGQPNKKDLHLTTLSPATLPFV